MILNPNHTYRNAEDTVRLVVINGAKGEPFDDHMVFAREWTRDGDDWEDEGRDFYDEREYADWVDMGQGQFLGRGEP